MDSSAGIVDKDAFLDYVVKFLTGNFPYSGELQAFWIAVQGAMTVRKVFNSQSQLHFWHAFCLSMVMGFGGGWMGFVWMGRPSSMLANDVNAASVLAAFALVNYTPLDVGYMLLNTTPFKVATVAFAQLFRSLGIAKFVMVCFEEFKNNPSPYYDIPVFGPIMYATLLGNMGGMLLNGFEGYNRDGMPWGFKNGTFLVRQFDWQQWRSLIEKRTHSSLLCSSPSPSSPTGLFCASMFHFYANDETGPVGTALRKAFPFSDMLGLDDRTFAVCFISLFMQIFNPQYNPIYADLLFFIPKKVPAPHAPVLSGSTPSAPLVNDAKADRSLDQPVAATGSGSKRSKKKKKKKAKQS